MARGRKHLSSGRTGTSQGEAPDDDARIERRRVKSRKYTTDYVARKYPDAEGRKAAYAARQALHRATVTRRDALQRLGLAAASWAVLGTASGSPSRTRGHATVALSRLNTERAFAWPHQDRLKKLSADARRWLSRLDGDDTQEGLRLRSSFAGIVRDAGTFDLDRRAELLGYAELACELRRRASAFSFLGSEDQVEHVFDLLSYANLLRVLDDTRGFRKLVTSACSLARDARVRHDKRAALFVHHQAVLLRMRANGSREDAITLDRLTREIDSDSATLDALRVKVEHYGRRSEWDKAFETEASVQAIVAKLGLPRAFALPASVHPLMGLEAARAKEDPAYRKEAREKAVEHLVPSAIRICEMTGSFYDYRRLTSTIRELGATDRFRVKQPNWETGALVYSFRARLESSTTRVEGGDVD